MALGRNPRELVDSSTLKLDLERNGQAPALARAALVGFLAERTDRTTLATLTLLVSELVSNAVLHSDAAASSEIVLHARLLEEDGSVRVEVTDRGSGFTPAPRDPDRHGGYGLYLVERQASRWGVDEQGGTRVWFELSGAARPPATRDARA